MASMSLEIDEIHIWRAGLNLPSGWVHELWSILTPEERTRAVRFQFPTHRDRFVIARGVLRILLGYYLDIPAERVTIEYLSCGKPFLHRDEAGPAVEFNLAHSHGLAVYAFGIARPLGIDLERVRPKLVDEDVYEYFFSPREAATLRGLSPSARTTAFLRCWTRKEAYLKARGDGMSVALDSFDVTLAPGEPPALLASREDPCDVMRWSFRDLPVAPGYVAALVVAGGGWQLIDRGWIGEPYSERVLREFTDPVSG
jgi:4'-phosphopantetheinyl transferase